MERCSWPFEGWQKTKCWRTNQFLPYSNKFLLSDLSGSKQSTDFENVKQSADFENVRNQLTF